jgi:hypothetical protein
MSSSHSTEYSKLYAMPVLNEVTGYNLPTGRGQKSHLVHHPLWSRERVGRAGAYAAFESVTTQ